MKQKMKSAVRQMLALVLCAAMLLPMLPAFAFAEDTSTQTDENVIYLLAGSDYQPRGESDPDVNMREILQTIKNAGYTHFDGLLFCGDYTSSLDNSAHTQAGITKIKNNLTNEGMTISENRMVFIQGNHDPMTDGIAKSGANDTDAYGVFVINEDDYMWNNSNKDRIQQTARNLKAYLDKKQPDGKPIFVLSHLPLHYSTRTYYDGDDHYGKYIFDVLNAAGARGLTIFYLYGHNHSQGFDSYLGGSVNFLTTGDKIWLANPEGSQEDKPTAYPLKFTYMNAGFVGHYVECPEGVDTTMTMSVFEIHEEGYVVVKKFDQNGLHVLRSGTGAYTKYRNRTDTEKTFGYTPNTVIYESPQTVKVLSVDLNLGALSGGQIKLGDTVEISVSVNDDQDYEAVWTSSEKSAVTVTANAEDSTKATVSAVGEGEATITVTVSPKGTAPDDSGTSTSYTRSFSVKSSATNGVTLVDSGTIYVRQPASWDTTFPARENSDFKQLVEDGAYFVLASGTKGYVDPAGQHVILGQGTENLSQEVVGKTITTNTLYDGTLYIDGADISDEYLWKFDNHQDFEKNFPNNTTNFECYFLRNKTPYAYEGKTHYRTLYAQEGYSYNNFTSNLRSSMTDKPANGNAWWHMTSDRGLETVGARILHYSDDNFHFETRMETNLNTRIYLYYPVTRTEPVIAYLNQNTGSVLQNADSGETGAYVIIQDGDSIKKIPVVLGMLSGEYDTTVPGTYSNLTVTYKGVTISTAFTLEVKTVDQPENPENPDNPEYPEYPEEGAVRVSKTGAAVDGFNKTGVAGIELSATGVPMNAGIDVMIVLDMSNSMQECLDHDWLNHNCGGDTRNQALQAALTEMLTILKQPLPDGSTPDIDVAISQFNSYNYFDGAKWLLNEGGGDYVGYENSAGSNGVVMPFTKAKDVVFNPSQSLVSASGTNYDIALQTAYSTLADKRAQNEANGKDREQILVFMSDGVPFQFNYIGGNSNDATWNHWLQGTMDENNLMSRMPQRAKDYFYNPDGRHWMAEAIKGDPSKTYPVIWNDSPTVNGAQFDPSENCKQVSGLGAKVYTIGFMLRADNQITVPTVEHVLKSIATDASYFKSATSAGELATVFKTIANDVTYAGENAYFLDTMGPEYDLNYLQNRTTSNGEPVRLTVEPKIEYKEYTLDSNGQRTGEPRILETVTFAVENGVLTGAYSTQIGNGKTNILKDGVIEASYFYYNLSSSTITRTVYGKEVQIAPETFCCLVGRITETERCLSYQVYLTGSMEGTRTKGSYDTNKSATLYYTNYLGNPCQKDTVSPVFPWDSAHVSYAFYLVDKDGNPVVNSTTGATGSFTESVKLTRPVSKEIPLNSGDGSESIEAMTLANLPEGYTLFDSGASYEIQVNSNGGGSWTITVGQDVDGKQTTYVTEYGGDPTTKISSENENGVDYTRTTVWFAVQYRIQTVPDTVVIDYGLPVDIHVLGNDIGFAQNAQLQYIGSLSQFDIPENKKPWEYLRDLEVSKTPVFETTEIDGSFGTAKVMDGKVRYTLSEANGMQMNKEEVFAYAVDYTGAPVTNDYSNGYYYSTVTVIPATTIYYEDSFVTFKSFDYASEQKIDSKWTVEGTTQNKVQDEDRPGAGSLSQIDADNLYGTDSAYSEMSTYSLGSAHKVTVKGTTDAKNNVVSGEYATAEFTFCGTGFDVISLTSNTTGTIVVEVTGKTNGVSKNYIVDTYYGYKYVDGAWVVDTDAKNALYQVPVIKASGLPYGQYAVKITASYAKLFDHGQYPAPEDENGFHSYDFYLDAIRIYDPANDGATSNTVKEAYVADKEGWPEYFELRNLIIKTNTFDSLGQDDSIAGIVFIDNTASGKTPTIEEYKNYGPNNELYLAAGQAVAFNLNVPRNETSNVASIQIAMKTVGNGSANVRVYDANSAAPATTTISTATDMYRDITGLNGKTVVISNDSNSTAILSITNVKVTYNSEHTDSIESDYFTVTQASTQTALMSLRRMAPVDPEPTEPEETVPETTAPEETVPETTAPEETVPETTEPEETEPTAPAETEPEEPEQFQPERFEVKISSTSVKVGSKVTVTVTTSKDVDSITINGETVTGYSSSKRGAVRTWKVRLTADTVGELPISVTAFRADGLASQPVVRTVTVTEKYTSIGNWLENSLLDLIGKLLGKNG